MEATMRWTSKAPSKGGFYWLRTITDGRPDGAPSVVEIKQSGKALELLSCGSMEWLVLKDFLLSRASWVRYEWAGPIPEPEDCDG